MGGRMAHVISFMCTCISLSFCRPHTKNSIYRLSIQVSHEMPCNVLLQGGHPSTLLKKIVVRH